MDYSRIITIEPDKRSGKPCIRGLRITVYDVLEYLASGMTQGQILDDFPDLTAEDIGKGGWERDGEVFWAEDSKRFAYLSSDLTSARPGGLKKQTAVFQSTGEAFGKVELPIPEKSGTEGDAKLSGATLIHDFVEPVQ